ncbi:hypothetical protein BD779DRAFT_492622 [Infundibulicybe gibba]|nr:hypothetical protein BD779DRAFT_492622 [Infundibulicybe gibba]
MSSFTLLEFNELVSAALRTSDECLTLEALPNAADRGLGSLGAKPVPVPEKGLRVSFHPVPPTPPLSSPLSAAAAATMLGRFKRHASSVFGAHSQPSPRRVPLPQRRHTTISPSPSYPSPTRTNTAATQHVQRPQTTTFLTFPWLPSTSSTLPHPLSNPQPLALRLYPPSLPPSLPHLPSPRSMIPSPPPPQAHPPFLLPS